jgi:ABC-type glycerol-3-phosphate transport system permease component
VVTYLFIFASLLFILFPYLWLIISSFKPTSELLAYPPKFISPNFSLENYITVFQRTKIGRFFVNSIITATSVSISAVILSVIGGYSLARIGFPGKRILLNAVLFVYIVPPIMLVVPLYDLLVRLQLVDTMLSLILSQMAHALPFTIWLLTIFFENLPIEVEEAAQVDGASRLSVLRRIVLPISLPAVATAFIFAFIDSWNDFLFASVLISSDELKTLPVGTYIFSLGAVIEWGWILSSGVIVSIPVLIFFLFFQRHLVSGLTTGAVKG